MEPAGGLVVGVVVRENKDLIELSVVVVVEGVSASTAVKDVFSKAAIKDVVPVATSEFVIAKAAVSGYLRRRRCISTSNSLPRPGGFKEC